MSIPELWIRIGVNPHYFGNLDSDLHVLKSKFRSFKGSKWSLGGPWTHILEAWRLKMELWMVCRTVVADSHHCDEVQDPGPHLSEESDPDSHLSEKMYP
jgi:hypothetical protein